MMIHLWILVENISLEGIAQAAFLMQQYPLAWRAYKSGSDLCVDAHTKLCIQILNGEKGFENIYNLLDEACEQIALKNEAR